MNQDRELVAAEAGGGVDGAHAVLQPASDLPQDHVTNAVTETVVDVLEVIDVHEQHSDGQAVAALAGERVRDAIAKQRPVGQPGERVVKGLMLQLRLEGLALADVADVEHDPSDVLVGQQVRAEHLDVAPGLARMTYAELGVSELAVDVDATEAMNDDSRCASSGWTMSASGRPASASGR